MARVKVFQNNIVGGLKRSRDTVFPKRVRQFLFFRLLQNWLFQGFVNAHWTEIIFRICLELSLVVSLFFVFSFWTNLAIVWIFVIVHTLMWTFNGHFWALKRSKNTRFVRNTPERIKKYIASMERRVIRASPITACVLSGSLTQGSFHEYSDIDVWFTKKRGFFNGLWAYFLGVRERSLAFLHRIPIELYFYDPENYIGKDSTEILILVKDTGERWKMVEPGSILLKDYPLNEMDFFK